MAYRGTLVDVLYADLTLFMQVAIREAKRQNLGYRGHALKCLGRVAAARTDIDMSDVVCDIASPMLEEMVQSDNDIDKMEVDGTGDGDAKK